VDIKFAAAVQLAVTNIITYGKKIFFDKYCKKNSFSDYDLARSLLADLSRTCSWNKVDHVLCNMLMSHD
jgi:hypothetical protein